MLTISKEELTRLHTALSSLESSILIEDENRIVRFANQALCNLFQMPLKAEQLVGFDCGAAASINKYLFIDEEEFINGLSKAINGEKILRNEKLLMKDGTILMRDYVPIFDEQKKYIGNIWNFKNVTVDYDRDAELRKQRRFYEDILNALPVDVAVFNDDYKYIFLNKPSVKNDELREWLIGKDDFDYAELKGLTKEFAVQRQSGYRRAKDDLESFDFEEVSKNEEGEQVIILRRIKPILVEETGDKMVVGCGFDITKQIESERKLQKIDSQYEYLVNRLNEVLFATDINGVIDFMNPAWTRLTGFEVKDTIGRKIQEFFSNDNAMQKAFFAKLISIEHTIGTKEYQLFTNDSLLWVSIDIEQHFIEERLVGYNGTITDISNQKLAEDHLMMNLQREKDLNDLKSKFVAMVSHEFRTPLAAISSSVEIMEMLENSEVKNSKEKVKEHLSKIGMQISRMTELMNEVLLISKIESGSLTPQVEQFDLIELIEDVKNEFIYTDFEFNVSSNVEHFPIKADRSMMMHILLNLTSNAIKYSPEKRVVDFNLYQNCNHAEISVRDYGIGIPDTDKQKLFTSFFRASNIRNIPGTGLGLIIVKHFLDMLNASITFQSMENKGTTFKIDMPNVIAK